MGAGLLQRACMAAVLTALLSGCVSLDSVSVTQVPEERSHRVSAEAHKWVIFFFSFSNAYVDEARDELRGKCKNGKITGILAKDETVNYFLGLVMKKRLDVEGYCIK